VYASIYLHRVPREGVEAFIRVVGAAADIYRRHGALDCVAYAPARVEAKYGCTAMGDAIDVSEDEVLFVELNEFRDQRHHDDVMAKVDADPQINRLYGELASLLDTGRIARAEFTRVV
jgi:uncharacterized protein YbaA (DUF1428 family)